MTGPQGLLTVLDNMRRNAYNWVYTTTYNKRLAHVLLMMLTDEPDPHHSSLLVVSTIQLTGSVPIRISSGQGGGGSLSVAYHNQSNHVRITRFIPG